MALRALLYGVDITMLLLASLWGVSANANELWKLSDGAHSLELLPIIDLKNSKSEGSWTLENGNLLTEGSKNAMLALPYDPPAEYDFLIEFTRLSGSDQVAQMFRYGDSQLVWSMGSYRTHMDLVAGDKDLVKKQDPEVGRANKKFVSVVKVRQGGVQVVLNEKVVAEYNGEVRNAKLPQQWRALGDSPLGVGNWYGQSIRITRIAILTGPGAPSGRIIKPSDAPRAPLTPHDSSSQANSSIIDVSVPSARVVPTTTPTDLPVDPAAIERAAYRHDPKPILKDLTSVTSMMVTIAPNGEASGGTSDIIAVVSPKSRLGDTAGIGFVRTDGDDTMKTSLEEAVRAVTLRYPIWAPGHIDISFGEKFATHGGPSAGTAFGVLMLSSLEGFSIDPKCAMTGDITVDWKVRKVGAVTAKLRGAALDKCLYALIPDGNEAAFADMGCLYGRPSIWGIQVFCIASLQDAVAIARTDRSDSVKQAIALFGELQQQLGKSETETLKNPQTKATLKQILQLSPNHLSAKQLLAVCDGSAPKTLSQNGTLYRLSVIFHPYVALLENKQELNRSTLPAYVTRLSRDRLNLLRPIADKTLLPLVSDISALVTAMDEFAGGSVSLQTVLSRALAVQERMAKLDSDPSFSERLVREGY